MRNENLETNFGHVKQIEGDGLLET